METIRALIQRLQEQSDRHAPPNELLATVNVLQSALQESVKENIKQVRSGNISVVFPSANRLVSHTPPPAESSKEEIVGWRVKQSPDAVGERERLFAESENQRRAEQEAVKDAERRRVAAQDSERLRISQEADRQRAAEQDTERQRLAAQEVERQRYIAQEAERQRIANAEADRQRYATQEAERQRVAAEEAERKRFAAQEAERQRIARDAERQRYAALEAESQRLADAETERQRVAAQSSVPRPVADHTRVQRDFSGTNFWQNPADPRTQDEETMYQPETEKWQPATVPELPGSDEQWRPKDNEEELHTGYRPSSPTGLKTATQQEINLRERNELFGQSLSLNDRHRSEQQEVGSALNDEPVKDLRKAIGINDRFVFLSELFRGDEVMYERSLKTINNFRIFPEAEYWIERELKVKLGWDESKATVKHFRQLVRRRFLG